MSVTKKPSRADGRPPLYVDLLAEFIQYLPEPAHIKEVKSGRYVASNPSNLLVYGLDKVEDLLGKNVSDLDTFMKPYWGDNFANEIWKWDHLVCEQSKVVVKKNVIFLDNTGLIHLQDMVKRPVRGEDGKIRYVATHSHEKTRDVDLLQLFCMFYSKAYPKTADACRYFCEYLNILDFFSTPPSATEIKVLLHSRKSRVKKNIARQMELCIKTIETHVYNINLKLKTLDFNTLITHIRAFNGSNKNFMLKNNTLCD